MAERWDGERPTPLRLTPIGAIVLLFLAMWAASIAGYYWSGEDDLTDLTNSPTAAGEGSAMVGVAAGVPPSPVAVAGRVSRGILPAASRHRHLPAVLLRIRWCESRDDYRAENSRSTAAGAWQILDGTWNGHRGYHHASHAPRWVQDEKALLLYLDRGTSPWDASRSCWR